jgi:hypothetical protein
MGYLFYIRKRQFLLCRGIAVKTHFAPGVAPRRDEKHEHVRRPVPDDIPELRQVF